MGRLLCGGSNRRTRLAGPNYARAIREVHDRASSGIGEATARALAAEGGQVAVVARRKDRLDALAAEIAGLAAIETDVTDREQALAARS